MEDIFEKYLCGFCLNNKCNCKKIENNKENNIETYKCVNYKYNNNKYFIKSYFDNNNKFVVETKKDTPKHILNSMSNKYDIIKFSE